MPEIKYAENPNEETAFVTQDDGTRSRAVLTATVEGDIEFPDNPNSTKVMVTVDGVKRRAVAVANVAGGGDQHNLGYYATRAALEEAYPTAEAGDWAIVGSTDTVWIWDTDNSEWIDSDQKGQVTSVNGQTGDVVLDALDVNAVPQYETLPQPTQEIYGEIAQYVGDYTGSYSAVGSASLGTISVDNDKFASTTTGVGGPTYVFRYDNAGVVAYFNQGEYEWSISSTLAAWDALCVALMGSTSDGTGLAYNGNDSWTLNWYIPVTTSQLESYGLVITGTPNASDSVWVSVARNGGWYKNRDVASFPTVDISETYGISYTGTPTNGDSITIYTIWEYVTGYFYRCLNGVWQQINTQPTPDPIKVNTTATLAVADWSSNTQTVVVNGVIADSVVFVSPAPASASDYASAGILCTAQAADSLTFTCTTTPSNTITVNVICM